MFFNPYPELSQQQLITQMNMLGKSRIPFLFIIDYKAEKGYIIKESELDDRYLRFDFREQKTGNPTELRSEIQWKTHPVSLSVYKHKFENIKSHIQKGNSFLTNLTQPTRITTNLSLLDLFRVGNAKYKLWLSERFTVLSPETFVRIQDGLITSYPMKGTIDASISCAKELILNDPKEKAEHATIVDLIRNDLSTIAVEVKVSRYRYVEKIKTFQKDLYQVSSEISGRLPENYNEHLGDLIFTLLPAGSICGAPKQKTLEIIEQTEGYDRGYYTGICGWFDGKNVDSAVMIRFIEQIDNQLIYKSGGGITSKSDLDKEYEELIQKVYVPVY